jgi:hypothetical protein
MTVRARWLLGGVLLGVGLAAWLLLRGEGDGDGSRETGRGALPPATSPLARSPGFTGAPAAPERSSESLGASSADGAAPPAQEDSRPRLAVRWAGAPVPMTRNPLPELSARPAAGWARDANPPKVVPLSPDGSSVVLTLAAGPHEVLLRSGGAVVWRAGLELRPGTQEVAIDGAHVPGVTGRCVDERGEPVEGVNVHIDSVLGGSVASVVSDAEGAFCVPFLSAELLYDGKADKPGYLDALVDLIELQPDRLVALPILAMRSARVVTGRVELPDGTPVASCPVHALVGKRRAQSHTDAEGRFRFEALPAGEARLWTQHSSPALLDAVAVLPDAEAERSATLVMGTGVFIDGTVRTEDGAKSNAFVWLQGVPVVAGGKPAVPEAATRSASVNGTPGTFQLGPFPPGPVEISDGMRGFPTFVMQAPGTVELVLQLRELEFTVRFTDASTGDPITRTGSLALLSRDAEGGVVGSSGAGAQVQPDARGVYTFSRRVSPLVVTSFVVRFPGYEAARFDALETQASRDAPFECAVEPARQLIVRVVDPAGAPVSGAQVYVAWRVGLDELSEFQAGTSWSMSRKAWFPDGASVPGNATTDVHGLAVLHRDSEGAMTCVVRAEGYLSWFRRFDRVPPLPTEGDPGSPAFTATLTSSPMRAP